MVALNESLRAAQLWLLDFVLVGVQIVRTFYKDKRTLTFDDRPKLADVFRRLRDGQGPLWVTWGNRRLLLALPSPAWLDAGVGRAIVATRRGYRMAEFVGKAADGGWTSSKAGRPKNQPFRTDSGYFDPVIEKRIRAVIREDHPRPSVSDTND